MFEKDIKSKVLTGGGNMLAHSQIFESNPFSKDAMKESLDVSAIEIQVDKVKDHLETLHAFFK